MLPAAARLRRRDEFTAVLKRGRRAGTSALVVHVLAPRDSTSGQPARAGFLVGRVVGNAVTRNRTRRRLRHLTRDRLATLPDGYDVVVRALPDSSSLTSDELDRALDTAWRRLLPGPRS